LQTTTTNTDFEAIKCFLLDMDGTIYLDEHLLPGALDFIQFLNESNIDYLFLTNNSSKAAEQYTIKLQTLGIDIPEERILTSGEATASYINAHYKNDSLFVVGTPALEGIFQFYEFKFDDINPDIVVLGFDTTMTYDKLWKCCNFIREGCRYIATHPDINCPTKDGFMPDIGSFIALIEASTGRKPDLIIGKPYTEMINAIKMRTGYHVNEICMIGDRLYTDIALGKSGIKTVLVLSGEANLADIEHAKIQPDHVVRDLSELVSILEMK